MKILLIEDNDEKRTNIQLSVESHLTGNVNSAEIISANTLSDARRFLLCDHFDLIIFDMYLPANDGSTQIEDCSLELIMEFSKSKNYQTEAIALTQYEINEVDNIQAFNQAGITLVHYDDTREWELALKLKISKASQKVKAPFLIFCALPSERNAYQNAECKIGATRNFFGMDCQEISIDGQSGFIIKPRAMGLVNMAILASKAIELFQPKIVAMSGICAGVESESNYLDIIVGKTCWEYQTGKWVSGEFKPEPYQNSLPRKLEIDLEQSTEDQKVLRAVREGLYNTELKDMKIKLAPISSGSAVIADTHEMRRIGHQHRKMAGLEMEMYALYEAALQSLCVPLFFGAKAVVDMGSSDKNDSYHDVGCIISARYTALMLREQLSKLD